MELAIAEPFNFPVDLTQYPEFMLDTEYLMDLNLIKARVDNHFYRRIDAIKYDIQYIANNAESFNIPKSDIVRNAKVITKLAIGESKSAVIKVMIMFCFTILKIQIFGTVNFDYLFKFLEPLHLKNSLNFK